MPNGFADSGDNTNFAPMSYSQTTHAGSGSFFQVGPGTTITAQPIKINQNKTYLFEVWARADNTAGIYPHFTGIVPIDADGNIMLPFMWTSMAGSSETTLATALNVGDTTINLTNATGWYEGNQGWTRHFGWWPYTNTQGFSYPAYTYTRNSSRFIAGSMYISNGTWPENGITGNVVTLSAPWPGPNLAAGTQVRSEFGNWSYFYTGISGITIPSAWTKYSGYINGNNVVTGPAYQKLPYGTDSVKIIFLNNYSAPAGSPNAVYYSDLWLSDISSTSTPLTLLEPDSIYKVVASSYNTNPLTATNNIWSKGSSADVASYSRAYNQEFSWRFKTKNQLCELSRVEVTPAEYSATSITEKTIFSSQPFSASDSCSVAGQPLDPWSVNWNWSSSNNNVATVSAFSTRGTNPYCTKSCILRGSTIPYSATAFKTSICGNGFLEAGEDCLTPNPSAGCSLNCRFFGTLATCGNGTVDAGEACDPANAATQIGCSSDCKNLGSTNSFNSNSTSTSVCGNGILGSGEDCDLGIKADYSNQRSASNCSTNCTHTGSQLSSRWCFDNAATYGGFAKADYDAACLSAVSRCGDGITGPDEDVGCEIGGGLHASWCNDNCLVANLANDPARYDVGCTPNAEGCDSRGQKIGSSLYYSNPSSCGDAAVGIGEDASCESNLTVNPRSLADPWALVRGVGLGTATGDPLAQRTNIVASTLVRANTVSGSGQFNILCGYHTDADCSVMNSGGVVYGVGSDSCCYARPVLVATTPPNFGGHICLNTALEADFTGQINSASLPNNYLIARGELGPNCAAGETNVTSLAVLENQIINQPWYLRAFNFVKNFFANIFGLSADAAPNFNPTVWCTGSDFGNASVINTSSSTSKILINLQKPLAKDTPYTVILTDGIKDVNGVSIGRPNNRFSSWRFSTDNALCEIDSVYVSPASWLFTSAGSSHNFIAVASSSKGMIQPIPNIYDWNFSWQPVSSPYITLSNTNQPAIAITSKNQNGSVEARAFANIIANQITSATGVVASGASKINIFLCENPWPPKNIAWPVSPFPYSDFAGNRDGFNMSANVFDGSSIPAATTGVGDGYFNFSTYYCADNGSFGVADDFPYLKPATQFTAASLRVNVGVCEDNGNACTISDPVTKFSNDCGNNIKCLATSPLKRFIFTNDKNTDGIGIQIFPNPKHLSSIDWYRSPKVMGGQGFSGEVKTTKLGNFEAVGDDNNKYVATLNYSNTNNSLYDVVYLFSINSDAKEETRHVFDEMVNNFKFNTNLTYNAGFCGATISTPNYLIKCSSDLDCPRGQVCSDQVEKLQRNYQRINDLKKLDVALQSYRLKNDKYPDLKEGSLLPGQTVSTWPSWQKFNTILGESLPVDPINKLGPGGTCKYNPGIFCFDNSSCPTGDNCVIHDAQTGWSDEDRRYSFACSTSSLAFRYMFDTSTNFIIKSHFEDPGVNISNLSAFVREYAFSDVGRYFGLRDWSTANNQAGICDGFVEISSSNNGDCGDGIINVGSNEKCDPPAQTEAVKTFCSLTGGTATVRTCSNTCQWSPWIPVTCASLSVCGNGIRETGEACDEGSALNGTYGRCNTSCSGLVAPYTGVGGSPGYCGDNAVNPTYELCDPGQIGVIKYATDMPNSCNWDCAMYGPYCGDGRIYAIDETCDNGNSSITSTPNGTVCVASGAPCNYCSNTCQTVTVQPPVCTSYSYNAWGSCIAGTQTRSVATANPVGCLGTPVLTQSCTNCTYVYTQGTCTYTGVGTNWTQSLAVFSATPAGCVGTPQTSQSCSAPACNYTYNTGACAYSGFGSFWNEPLTLVSSTPAGCVGTPQTSQSCAAPTCAYAYSAGTCTYSGTGTIWNEPLTVLTASPTGCSGTPSSTRPCATPTCSSFTYNAGTCTYSGSGTTWTQPLTVTNSFPTGCIGGSPSTTQTCATPTCTYTYNAGTCTYSGSGTIWNQALTVSSANPSGCTGTPLTTQSCTAPTCSYSYSGWSTCQLTTGQTRTYTATPTGCVGTPGALTQTCCGDGIQNGSEQCDSGLSNGTVCTPPYNNSCTYCSNTCTNVVQPRQAWCGDGIVQSPNETCEADASCTVGSLFGNRDCNLATCNWTTGTCDPIARSLVITDNGTSPTGFNLPGYTNLLTQIFGTGAATSIKIATVPINNGSGADGSVTISATKNINTDIIKTGRTCADGVLYNVMVLTSLTATLNSTPAAGCLATGDKIILINMQGATTLDTDVNTGNYEFLDVQSVSGNVVTFTSSKQLYYGQTTGSDSNLGISVNNQRVILQRVPQYMDVTIASGGVLTASAWNGTNGGLMVFYARGTVTVASGGMILMIGKGYRSAGTSGESTLSIQSGQGSGLDGYVDDTGDYYCPIGIYAYGPGGGSYGTQGQAPGLSATYNSGYAYGNSNLSKIFLGSGGGGVGGAGSGIVYINGNSIIVSSGGYIYNYGQSAVYGWGGAGGAGGSIYLKGNTVNLANGFVTAYSGSADSFPWFTDECSSLYPGNGGVGRIKIESNSVTGVTNPAATVVSSINYYSSGNYTSGPVQVGPSVTSWGAISWLSTLTAGQSVAMQVRSANNSAMTGASSWCSVASGNTAACLRAGDTYLQYQASLANGSNLTLTPSLDSITINYFGYSP
jgi:cysteine-rich repeat protein